MFEMNIETLKVELIELQGTGYLRFEGGYWYRDITKGWAITSLEESITLETKYQDTKRKKRLEWLEGLV